MTRWQQFYREDPRVLAAAHTRCVEYATDCFYSHGKRVILDLGCGTGRDTAFLADCGFTMVGVDAARTGLLYAQQKPSTAFLLIEADARCLPFADGSFDGVYCFGLLHEFINPSADEDVGSVMSGIERVLRPHGLLILTVLAGEPNQGMPHVRLFNEAMLDKATGRFTCLDKRILNDTGCTGSKDYRVWRGVYNKT